MRRLSRKCPLSDSGHAAVASRLDREQCPGTTTSTHFLALDWLRGHASAETYAKFLKWAERVAPLGQ